MRERGKFSGQDHSQAESNLDRAKSFGQHVNFDFVVENTTGETLNISLVEVSVFDRAGKLEVERHLDGSGFSPNILLIPNREMGDGKVVSVANDYPEDFGGTMLKPENVAKDPMLIAGNQVTIDHANGEFSMLVHLKHGSVRVKPDDGVKQGEVIAAVGVSGSAEEPHLHYELRTGPGLNVEGLPSYYTQFCRLLGSRSIAVERGRIDTGDIVITKPHSLTACGPVAIGPETFSPGAG